MYIYKYINKLIIYGKIFSGQFYQIHESAAAAMIYGKVYCMR